MKQNHSSHIAVFDFDGTLINCDSLPDFLLQTFGWKIFLLHLPLIMTMRIVSLIGFLSEEIAKERVLTAFLQNMKQEDFEAACHRYAQRIPLLLYPAALAEIKKHQESGHEIVIISASIPNWIRPWAETIGIEMVEGTEMEIKNGSLTGHFSTPNCKGKEKVHRLRKLFSDLDSYTLSVYGDSSGDKDLLAIANFANYKPFR